METNGTPAEPVKPLVPALSDFDFAEQVEALAQDIERLESDAIVQIAARVGKGHELFLHRRDEGGFRGWVKNRLEYSRAHGYRLLNVNRMVSQGWNTFGTLSVSAVYLLAEPNTPDEARQKVAQRIEGGERWLSYAAVAGTIAQVKSGAASGQAGDGHDGNDDDEGDDHDDDDGGGDDGHDNADQDDNDGVPAPCTPGAPVRRRSKAERIAEKAHQSASFICTILATLGSDGEHIDKTLELLRTRYLDDLAEVARNSSVRAIIAAVAAKLGGDGHDHELRMQVIGLQSETDEQQARITELQARITELEAQLRAVSVAPSTAQRDLSIPADLSVPPFMQRHKDADARDKAPVDESK